MSSPRYARLASRLLGRVTASTVLAPPTADARAVTIAAIAKGIEARARIRRLQLWAAGVAAAAAVAVAVFAEKRVLGPGPVLIATSPVTTETVQVVGRALEPSGSLMVTGGRSDGWPVHAGSRVVAPRDGSILLSYSTGTTAVLAAGSDLTLVGASAVQVLHLDRGSVDLHVAKLAAAERFLVDTSDAEVEVRGTRFTVSVAPPDPSCGGGTSTRVVVTEGVVVVRRSGGEVRVSAGEHWPSGCGTASNAPTVLATDLPRAATSAPAVTPATTPASRLAEQNAMFAAAVAARRRGDGRAALSALDHLLALYPGGPLDESASVERLRLLPALDPARAPAAARDYLARYPSGFARSEAEAIDAGAP